MQSVWLIILRSGNTSIKWLEMILRIKAQKKFIIFACMRGGESMARIIMCGSFKGGVGKTASSWNLAYSLAEMGKGFWLLILTARPI